jgi:hypothetical protein
MYSLRLGCALVRNILMSCQLGLASGNGLIKVTQQTN